ncbi:hypothetical protein MMC14_010214 [Varicellaria rhodocarpa]|nr:hypothetical protein [Varicellaria rhodocarpa]
MIIVEYFISPRTFTLIQQPSHLPSSHIRPFYLLYSIKLDCAKSKTNSDHIPPCFLTCYHCIRSEDSQKQYHQDAHGIEFCLRNSDTTLVECSAALDYEQTRQIAEKSGQKQPLAKLEDMVNNAVKGHVIAASGYRVTIRNRLLDWAHVCYTSGGNVPLSHTIPSKEISSLGQFPENYTYSKTKDSLIRQMSRAKLSDWVAKKGRTSDWTTGFVNRMDRIWKCDDPEGPIWLGTKEAEVMWCGSDATPFANRRDSGSLVHNKEGELVGILLARDENGVGIILHIQDVQEDVKKMTGEFLSLE